MEQERTELFAKVRGGSLRLQVPAALQTRRASRLLLSQSRALTKTATQRRVEASTVNPANHLVKLPNKLCRIVG